MAMKKNVAGQKVGAQMITAADGTNFTGSVTVYVTGDAGTQAAGSVGSGACTHEGKGYHTYAPDQAETNYDLAAFTFEGTGAITATVHERPDTVAADLVTLATYVDTEVAAIKAKTDNLPSDPADASVVAGLIAALQTILDKLDDTLEDDGGTYRFTTNALEQSPAESFAWQVGAALPGFTFTMRQAANPGLGADGLTVTAERFDGTGWEACENVPVGVGNGGYVIDFEIADGEASGERIAFFRFSAATAIDTFVTLILKPAP